MSPRNARLLLGVLTALAASAPTAAEAATTVTLTGGVLTIDGDNGADDVLLEYAYIGQAPISGDGVRVSNPAGVVPGAGCIPESTTQAACSAPTDSVEATLGGGDDKLRDEAYLEAPMAVEGEAGNDQLGPGYGSFDGGDGNDVLISDGYTDSPLKGGPGSDVVRSIYEGWFAIGGGGSGVAGDVERVEGSPYEDYFAIGDGAHPELVVAAGSGSDIVSYSMIFEGIAASLDNAANDGPGGRQQLLDAEGIYGGYGNDSITGNGQSNVLAGGAGDDRVTGGGEADQMYGGPGNDTLLGGDGGDLLGGGSGADALRGDAGTDVVSYREAPEAVTVALDGRANDGASGEGDDLGADIERVDGSDFDDTITGGDGDEEIDGGDGADRLDGGGGKDKLRGGGGSDSVKGGAGADDLRGGPGDDAIDGGSGEDHVIAQDRSDGDEARDVVELRDGEKDTAVCAAGITRITADHVDVVSPSCAVERSGPPPPPAPGPPAGPSPTPSGPLLKIARQRVRVDRKGVARLRVSCPKGAAACAGVLRFVAVRKKKPLIVATYVYAIPGGKARTVRVKLNKRGRRLLRARRGVMRVDVTLSARERGAAQTKVQAVRLRRR